MSRKSFSSALCLSISFLFWGALAFSNEHAAQPAHAAHGAPGISADKALSSLKEGNQRFIEDRVLHSHQDLSRRKELVSGQKPHSIILSCSDSRVPPELIFDQGLGDIFTVRVAGNVLGAATVASMEYAVEHLGARLIVVMGHESCGAVKAALSTPVGESTGSYDLDSLVSSIQNNLEGGSHRALASEDKTLRQPVMKNVEAVVKSLSQRSKVIKKAVDEGKLRIVPAIYGLDSGKVDFF